MSPRRKPRSRARRLGLGLAVTVAALAALGASAYALFLRMPGASHRGPAPPLAPGELAIRDGLRADVERLAGDIGERNLRLPAKLARAADLVDGAFAKAGYAPQRQSYEVDAERCDNIEVELRGEAGDVQAGEIVVVGAHYDSAIYATGADDNASGVAALLALARAFEGRRPRRTLRFVAFVNEENPYAMTGTMGSLVYARRSRAKGERIVAMLSLETLAYFTDAPGSQKYPALLGALYPTTGNFIAFVADVASRDLVRRAVSVFRATTPFPSEAAALPASTPGVGWSDHWAFWQLGYPAIMVTDTAPFRYPYYHTLEDTPDKLDFDRAARVVSGLARVVEDLVGLAPP